MGDLRALVSDLLGCASVYASSDPCEVRCLVDPLRGESSDVQEWLIRQLPRDGIRLGEGGDATETTASEFPQSDRDHSLEKQLDTILGLVKHRRLTDNIPVEDNTLKAEVQHHVLDILYNDIPRYSPHQPPQEILSGLMTKQATPRWSSFGRLRGVVETTDGTELAIFDYEHQSLQDLLKFNQSLLDGDEKAPDASVSDAKRRFLVYQLWELVKILHDRRLSCNGSLVPSQIWITDSMWIRLGVVPLATTSPDETDHSQLESPRLTVEQITSNSPTERWCSGDLTNFEYLMILNAAAGRRMIDSVFHPVLPWVSDFSSRHGGWRDLSKSKFRLNKGDNQLDRNYESSVIPHHITESLSEITFYIYMARRTPMTALRRLVRSNFQPKEYPSTMERMFQWTPDECIPEFFSDASVFSTIHGNSVMPDMVLPNWCADASDFIRAHRMMLESDEVSTHLHKWIDLNFGVCLSGDDAVRNKNVPLKTTLGAGYARKSPGFIQLFQLSHPQRRVSKPHTHISDSQGEPSRGVTSRYRGGTAAIPSSADTDLQAAIQIAEDAMSETSFYTPADNSQHGQLQGILSSPAVAEKKSLSSSFVKLKKKHKTRPKFSTGSDSSPVSPPAGKESGQSRSPTMARFAHAIPKFFSADSPSHQSGVYSDQGSLTTAPSTASSGSQLQSSSSFGPSAGHHDSGRGVSHPRPGSAPLAAAHSSLPPTIIPSSAGVHASQGTHIFRDLWHQLSRLEDDEMNDSVEEDNRIPDLEWTGADFDTLDDTSLLLLRACPPICMQSEPNDLVDHPRPKDTVEPVDTVAIHPVYALPTSWNTVMEKDGSMSAVDIAFSADLFSVGCMMAEIFTGRPLFSARSVGYYYSSYVEECGDQQPETTVKSSWPAQYAIEEQLASIPVDIKNTILDFVHPHPRHRISAWRARSSPTPESCYQRQHAYATDAYGPCNASIFPPGFRVVYEYSAHFSRTKHWWDRLEVARENLPALVRLPDAAFQVALPSFLNLFNSESYTDTLNTAQVCAATVYLLGGLTRRLGRADTRLQLFDVLLRVYETSDLPPVLKLCMSTPDVLKTILTAFGPVKMLRHFFQPLVDWLTAPPDYRRRHDDTRDESNTRPLPLFSSEAANMLATSLGELCSSDFMGPSIAVKYILPSLLPLLGKVQAKWTRLNDERSFIRNDSRSIAGPTGSRSAYGGKNGDGIHVAYVQKQVLYESHYVADTILLVCRELPSSVVGEIVLPHLCDVVPQLVDVAESVSSRIEGVPDELAREVYVTFRVLRNVVRSVAEQTVQREFLQRRASMLVALVNRVQPPFLHPRTADAILSSIKSTARTGTSERPTLTRYNSAPVPASSRRSKQIEDRLLMLQTDKALDLRAFTAIGVARTVTAALLKVGAECAAGATGILQSIDAFLVRCAAIYSELEASDYQWSMASEVVSEFCSPLRTLFGSEAFAKFLPSVQSSSVLQMLLLPNPPGRKGDVGALESFHVKEAKKQFHRQTTLVTNRIAGDEDVTADHIEVAVLARHVPELLQGAYRSARLNGIKTASFLHVSLHFGSVWDQDLNEAIFLVQEQRKKRRAASTSSKAGGEAAWLRPRASSYFSARQDDPARSNVSLPAFAGPPSELLGRSWPLRSEIRHNIRAHSSSTRSIHVDQDEDIVVSASKNGSCRVWRLASYPSQPTGTVHFESTNLLSARSLEDGKRAVATSSTAVHVWDIRSSQVMFHIPFAEEGVTSCTPLRMLPFKHYQDFAQSTRASPSQAMFALQGHADFAVNTARKLLIVDARAAPRVVADWRVDTRASTCISTTALVITPANGVGLIASGTTSGQVFLTDKRMGKCIYHWQALVESRVVKIVQYAPSYILVVGSDREARVWKIDKETQPRLRMIVANVPEGVRETQVSVQAYADSVLLYVAASAKLYTTRLIHDASPEAVRSEISTVRLESWSLLDNLTTGSGAGVNNGIGGDRTGAANSPERGRLHRTKMSAQSVAVLPLRQVVLIGGDDGSLRTCV